MDEKKWKKLGIYLRNRRQELGKSLRAIGSSESLEHAHLSKLERGKLNNVTLDVLVRVSRAYELSALELAEMLLKEQEPGQELPASLAQEELDQLLFPKAVPANGPAPLDTASLSNFVVAALAERDLTYADVASVVDISQSTISRIVNENRQDLSALTLSKLSYALNKNLVEILFATFPSAFRPEALGELLARMPPVEVAKSLRASPKIKEILSSTAKNQEEYIALLKTQLQRLITKLNQLHWTTAIIHRLTSPDQAEVTADQIKELVDNEFEGVVRDLEKSIPDLGVLEEEVASLPERSEHHATLDR